ncbi:glycine zipper 2TM domain-containing protein [Pseudomarimonas salicorniae]|uniref:Glycine zipper 2TM domain-containing protein n=1 Tax=Pseudomarimonas salicorniae TaxID=2933270 RepID=A0ABT0GDN6_9GAMM|nr:glycine zipper 2TM domain-containing protein [Lysobacter sp. CAU 1642]MCK7592660.1 glycine zipper 2TM domain-containing protein [Lysobacter sp. CAU 1642]
MVRKSVLALATLGVMAASNAGATSYGRHHGPSGYDYAEVIRVDPIIERYQRPVQRDQCWREPVRYREPARYRHAREDRGPAVLGAIVGGVIGSQFGSGGGRDAATAAGAILGYQAVRNDQRRYGGGYYEGGREYVRYEERCRVNTEYFSEERVTGYDVTYRYNGQVFNTVTDYHPGDRLRVQVDIRPVP